MTLLMFLSGFTGSRAKNIGRLHTRDVQVVEMLWYGRLDCNFAQEMLCPLQIFSFLSTWLVIHVLWQYYIVIPAK